MIRWEHVNLINTLYVLQGSLIILVASDTDYIDTTYCLLSINTKQNRQEYSKPI